HARPPRRLRRVQVLGDDVRALPGQEGVEVELVGQRRRELREVSRVVRPEIRVRVVGVELIGSVVVFGAVRGLGVVRATSALGAGLVGAIDVAGVDVAGVVASLHRAHPGQCGPSGTNGTVLLRSFGGSRASRIGATSSGRYSCEKCMSTMRSLAN